MAIGHAPHEDFLNIFSLLILTTIIGTFGIVAYFILFKKTDSVEEKEVIKDDEASKKKNILANEEKHIEKQQPPFKKKNLKDLNSHPFLLASLKGHTGSVLDLQFSSNGKFLGSVSEDRTARLWSVKSFQQKDHKYTRVNIEYDHATGMAFSPDSKAFVVSLGLGKTVRVFKIHKKKDEGSSNFSLLSVTQETVDFPVEHKADIIAVGVSSSGKFIMTASKDTQITIWSLKGEVYDKIDTLLIYNTNASISPCGNLVAACGFTADVKMWHIGFKKTGDFHQVSKGLELKGHSAGVLSFSFSNDSRRIATVSKDKTWKVWDIDVDYLKGQDAYLLHTGQYNGAIDDVSTLISLSHDHFTVAIATGPSIFLYDVVTEKLGETLEHVHQGNITCLRWHAESRQLVSAGGSDRSIKVWHNPVGVKANLQDLLVKLPKAKGDSMKERMQHQIAECKTYLKMFEK